jgi:hypothetical protein
MGIPNWALETFFLSGAFFYRLIQLLSIGSFIPKELYGRRYFLLVGLKPHPRGWERPHQTTLGSIQDPRSSLPRAAEGFDEN